MSNTDVECWDLPITGFEVLEVWLSGEIYLIAYGDKDSSAPEAASDRFAPRTSISFGGQFMYQAANGSKQVLDASGSWETLTPLLALRHIRISKAVADATGHLRLIFENGSTIDAGPDPHYENWGMSGPGRLILAAPPGGGNPHISS